MLSNYEKHRYSRHLSLPDFGEEQQLKLKNAKVLVVGCGGLGSPVMLYLAGAGIGCIGLIDDDVVELSNLQRQVVFLEEDLNQSKAEKSADRLRRYNKDIEINAYSIRLTTENVMPLIDEYDIIIDCSDNLPTRYLLNDASIFKNKILVHGSIFRYEGHVSVFNLPQEGGGRSANYRDLFPHPPPPELVTSCAAGGVLGVLPGIIGALMANEVIKIVTGYGDILADKLLLVDALGIGFTKIKIKKNPLNPITGDNPSQFSLIDYELFCAGEQHNDNSISSRELDEMMRNNIKFVLIDVRKPIEYARDNLGGELIPVDQIESAVNSIPREGRVIFMCQSGMRSQKAIDILQKKYGYDNLINLEGGLTAYRRSQQKQDYY